MSHRRTSSTGGRYDTLLRMERLEERLALSSLPAFPGAEGYGMFATGGRGGSVYEVTTLANSGPGSLRDAVSGSNRTIVFRVSGTIELASNLLVTGDNLTIAGQTAPGGGITLKNFGMRLDGAENVIIRYIRVRPGDTGTDNQVDGIGFTNAGAKNVIFDHVSASWGIDETFSFYGLPNVTIQWSIISEGLMNSKHPNGAHSMGGIQNGWNTSLHHNLYISNNQRNPKFNIADWWPGQNTDFRNNVVYNWGVLATHGGNGGSTLTNVVNNYYKYGPSTSVSARSQFLSLEGGSPGEWFVDGNYVYGYPAITADNWTGVASAGNGIQVDVPFASAPVTTQTALDAYDSVLLYAGANVPHRDAVDTRLVNDVTNGTGAIINSQTAVGGWPTLPTAAAPADNDQDGMPNAWETANGLNPNSAADRNGVTPSGYTNLEVYLNSLVPTLGSLAEPGAAAQAFWPLPADGNTQEDASVQLRWKAGFNTTSERIYFGTDENLTEADFKVEKAVTQSVVNKQLITSSFYTPGQLQNGTTYYWRIDSVNENGTTTGETWSFTPGLPVAGPGAGNRMEAENMTRSRAFVNTTFTEVPSEIGAVRYTFNKLSGVYDIDVRYIDEDDGAGLFELYRNSDLIGSWTANATTWQYRVQSFNDVEINTGDVLKVVSRRHQDELGRVDYVETVFQSALAGDFNVDGQVDGLDFLEWQVNPSIGNLADWEANYGDGAPPPMIAAFESGSAPETFVDDTFVDPEQAVAESSLLAGDGVDDSDYRFLIWDKLAGQDAPSAAHYDRPPARGRHERAVWHDWVSRDAIRALADAATHVRDDLFASDRLHAALADEYFAVADSEEDLADQIRPKCYRPLRGQ